MAASGTTDQLEINVKIIGMIGKNNESVLSFFIDGSANVRDLKKKISTELQFTNDDCGIERQRLIFLGRMLRVEEENLIKDARMKTDSVNWIHLCPLPVGAQPSARDDRDNESRTYQPQMTRMRGQLRSARERRRNRMESLRAGFHPYAMAGIPMAVPTRVVLSSGSGAFFSAFSTSVPESYEAATIGQGTANPSSSSPSLAPPAGARSRSTRRTTATARVGASTGNGHSGTADNDGPIILNSLFADGPESRSEAGIMSMLERSIAGAVSDDTSTASRNRTERMRRADLTQLLELTARTTPTSLSPVQVARRSRSERAAAPAPARATTTALGRRSAATREAPQTTLRRSTRRRTGNI